ncbi:MAG: hypothetical protein OIN84_03210 [Candidatus Methanoperedens sp.]|uniref:hypothetical protein n=1 Tax=Candidatus Methanoperedens sp. BLZ2 TaxID=2035255 RepID=UPI000BE2CE73|nr:hypothetical protein [Candidatus Methanoperedens sp. BLZ2]KAB2948264.1 MAG: hypothetical protein F9K14_00045 [Candidatus Methanoperedens sp.]MBZ0174812.1 hypothetical protein [Candidatus Methanoperedens nitroreducens]MCX9076965.1 hypothetical protein [Candidatus Methanoperedens sp.]
MKNQYFGDIRDLFKYDLILRICKENALTERVLFIPMLTKNDGKLDGNKIDYSKAKAGTKNEELKCYLTNCIQNNRRNVAEIEFYFKSKGMEIYIHNESFVKSGRKNYFEKLLKEKLPFFSHCLIFLDPDIGLEVKASKEKHLLYGEVEELYNKMDANSILMIYQHFPRESHVEYRCRRAKDLKNKTKDFPLQISDNEIIFFFLTKNKDVKSQLESKLNYYKIKYPNLDHNFNQMMCL